MSGGSGRNLDKSYTRREAVAALAKYSVALGGAATTIVTADGLVSAASAYWDDDKLARFCEKNPTHWKCAGFTPSAASRVLY